MFKKVTKIAAMFCMLAFAGNSFAQSVEDPIYPQYGFWSNWGIGVSGSFMWQPDAKQFYGVQDLGWGSGFNAGLGVILQKEVERGTWLRFRYNHTALFGDCNKNNPGQFTTQWNVKDADSLKSMDRHSALTAEYVLSLNNSFHNWKPETRGNLYLFAGAGLAFSHNQARGFYNVGTQIDGGLGFSYRICDRSTIFCELEADVISDAPLFWKKNVGFHHTDFLATVGYIFNLGITAADQELIAQRAMITKEAMDALEDENDNLKKEVAAAKDNEKKLKGQIDDLNAENDRIRQESLARAQRVSDSLNGVLDQLKNDQLTYYAIPFSVLYPNDGWHVSDSEMIKVKAICRIMKDNPDVKLTVVGFCDYTASDAYNMKLSQRRAEEVKRLMVKKYGIDADRITVDWKGKTVAFGDIKYELNRRVSFYRVIE
ncbi:MAG: OmpA family protein [Bacteroidales bacterium]|nr:OmpA family protein [Candidatus Colimorpha merdihippi]